MRTPPAAQHPRISLRVLVADRTVLVNEGLTTLLSELEGITVFGCAQNSSKVLALVQTVHPDVVILDLNVPGTAGLRTLARLKKAQPETPVIILSHYQLEPLRRACLEGGADYFFGKTASFERVCETLKGMMRAKKKRGRPVEVRRPAMRI